MTVYLNKGTPREEVYTKEKLEQMSIQELRTLKARIQRVIEEVALKKSIYMNENNEEYNSHEYWKKINNYKTVMTINKSYLAYIKTFEPNAPNVPVLTRERKDVEHWLYCFYQESKVLLSEETVKMIEANADDKAGYHCDFNKEAEKCTNQIL